MQRKWISLLCVFCLMISACSGPGPKGQGDLGPKPDQDQLGPGPQPDQAGEAEEAEQTPGQIKLENIVNAGVYKGFTPGQEAMLEKNGFIIMEPNFDDHLYFKMHQSYENIEYANHSVIITTDSVLNMWHVFYSESMKNLEQSKYLPDLVALSEQMERKAIEEYHHAPDALDGAYANVMAYFHVANILLESPESGLRSSINADAMGLVQAELANIQGETISYSPLFGRRIDYSQFKVRGHYTLSPDLGKYFKAMMWYGLTGFDLEKNPVEPALITNMLKEDKKLVDLWQGIYNLTALYSGASDDVTFYQVLDALSIFDQKNLVQELAKQEGLDLAIKAYQDKVASPRIVASLSEDNEDMNAKKVFKFMGQRFSIDAYIMQNLVMPTVRPVATAFDVFAAMGSATAEKVLRENYTTNQDWPEYDTRLDQMKKDYQEETASYGALSTFYNTWIKAIDHSLNYVPEGQVPYFMTTPAYEYKKLNTALGSFAELKHDNILYSKQVAAEMGGPEGNQTLHYLEPNVALYQELFDLTERAQDQLRQAQVSEDFIRPLSNMKDLLQVFVTVSQKELRGEDISSEELQEMAYFGGLVDHMTLYYGYLLANEGLTQGGQSDTSALVADIHTILSSNQMPGAYVEVASGLPYEIYVLCHVNGVDFLARGVVYSGFEFLSQSRLTDQEWEAKLGIEYEEIADMDLKVPQINPANYDQIRQLHMPYFKEFSTDEPNQVTVDYEVEVANWPILAE